MKNGCRIAMERGRRFAIGISHAILLYRQNLFRERLRQERFRQEAPGRLFMGDQIGIMMTFNQSKAFLQGEIQRGELLIQFVFFVIAVFFFIDSDMPLTSFVFYLGAWGVFN